VEAAARAAIALDNDVDDLGSLVGVDDRHRAPDQLSRSAVGMVPPARSNIPAHPRRSWS
jgi:hypothetical protein